MADTSRILITGATGFIGRCLLGRLGGSYEIHALARRSVPSDRSDVHWIRQDISRPLERARLPERIDAVIHLAQSRHYREFPERADDIFRVNAASTLDLLDYARGAGAERFILASSGGVYGRSYEDRVETDPVDPLDFYLTSKYTAELLVGNYSSCFTSTVFRFFFVYGPGQTGMLIPSLLRKIRDDETITIDGDPGIRINPIFVEDAVSVFEPALALSTSDLFNVAGDEVVTLTELVGRCAEALGRRARIEYNDAAHPGDLVASNDRIKRILAVEPRTDLVQGLKATVDAGGQFG